MERPQLPNSIGKKNLKAASQQESCSLDSESGRKLGQALVSLFRRRNFQKGGYWMEWTEKDEKHQIFISLQLPDSRRSGAS
jgi:hypothetical protein